MGKTLEELQPILKSGDWLLLPRHYRAFEIRVVSEGVELAEYKPNVRACPDYHWHSQLRFVRIPKEKMDLVIAECS